MDVRKPDVGDIMAMLCSFYKVFPSSEKDLLHHIQTQPQPLVSAAVYAPTALGILLGHCNLDELDFVSRCMIMVLQWFIMASDGFYGLITRKS